jgi:hypothetical protein
MKLSPPGKPFADIFKTPHAGQKRTMRTIHVVLPLAVALLLGAAGSVWAQGEQPALVGLSQYGVTLTETADNQVIENHSMIENHSSRTVIGYVVKHADQNAEERKIKIFSRQAVHLASYLSFGPMSITSIVSSWHSEPWGERYSACVPSAFYFRLEDLIIGE